MNNSYFKNFGMGMKTAGMKRANIVFFVMFIMFVSSLLGLLISQYVQYMVQTANIFKNYYSTYYLTYGGLELGLTQVKYHGYGFEGTMITTGSSCRSSNCQVNTTITARSSVIGDTYEQRSSCSSLAASGGETHTYMQLGSGDCFISPLYYDASSGFDAISYDQIDSVTQFLNTTSPGGYNPVLYNNYVGGSGTGEEYSLRIIDEELSNLDSLLEPTTASPVAYNFTNDMTDYPSANNYFIIANPTATTKEFCLELSNSNELPMKYVTVVSIGEDGNNTIALNAVKNNELPSFLCYGAINP